MTNEKKQQFTLRISQANSTELIVILYEMTLEYLADCETILNQYSAAKELKQLTLQRDAERELKTAVYNARGCLNELIQSLHLEYHPAPQLLRLYYFCIRSLANAEVRKNLDAIQDIRKVIEPLKEAYEIVAKENTAGAVMDNSQAIYVGLTYGKNTLTENLADQGTNRGMLV